MGPIGTVEAKRESAQQTTSFVIEKGLSRREAKFFFSLPTEM